MKIRPYAVCALFLLASLSSRCNQAFSDTFYTARNKLDVYDVGSISYRQSFEHQVSNIYDGMDWVNHRLRNEKQYCPPATLSVTASLIINILRREITQEPKIGEEPIGLAILLSVARTFPCTKAYD